MEKLFLAALQMTPGVGAAHLRRLVERFGGGEAAWKASAREIDGCGCLPKEVGERLISLRQKVDIERLGEQWERKNIGLCGMEDEEYPENLKNIFNPPLVLFYRGRFAAVPRRIAIVGARQASAYGRNIASRLAADLAAADVDVVSGAARGIDAAAHEGALTEGRTTAVLGCGIDVAYPRENAALLERIAASGLIVSEYAPGVRAHPAYFPARNRIISGLSAGVVVVEAALRSGSLITAELALGEGRDVFAVPGSVFSALSRGCHRLLRDGAKLVEGANDILEEYGWARPQRPTAAPPQLSPEERAVYRALSGDAPLSLDEIVLKTRREASHIAFLLLQLQLRGIVKETALRCYVRAVKEDVL